MEQKKEKTFGSNVRTFDSTIEQFYMTYIQSFTLGAFE